MVNTQYGDGGGGSDGGVGGIRGSRFSDMCSKYYDAGGRRGSSYYGSGSMS